MEEWKKVPKSGGGGKGAQVKDLSPKVILVLTFGDASKIPES